MSVPVDTNNKHNSSESQESKPPLLLRLENKKGDHLWIVPDMGWKDEFWAEIKAKGVIDPLMDMNPPQWTMIRIPFEREDAYRKFAGRHALPEYFLIRAMDDGKMKSYIFLHSGRLDRKVSTKLGKKYPEISQTKLKGISFKKKLEELLKPEVHPDIRGVKRYNASHTLLKKLRLARVKQLINMAKENEEHPLVELPVGAHFTRRLASYLKADKPLISKVGSRKHGLEEICRLLCEADSEAASETDKIGTSQIAEILRILELKEGWGNLFKLPKRTLKAGMKVDREKTTPDGEHVYREQRKGKLSARYNREGTSADSWETDDIPKPDWKPPA